MQSPNPSDDAERSEKEDLGIFQEYADATESGDPQKIEEATISTYLRIMEEADKKGPSPWLQAMQQAHACEAAFDWDGAEASYLRAAQVNDSAMMQSKAYDSLSHFYRLLDHNEKALQAAKKASELARSEAISNLKWMMLRSEANMFLINADLSGAATLIEEAFTLIGEGNRHDLARALNTLMRARYYLAMSDIERCEIDLVAVWSIIQPHRDFQIAGGYQGAFASWWTIKARLQAEQGKLAEAAESWRESVRFDRIIAQLPQLEGPYKYNWLAVGLRDLGRALRVINDPLAADSFRESASIRKSIGLQPLPE